MQHVKPLLFLLVLVPGLRALAQPADLDHRVQDEVFSLTAGEATMRFTTVKPFLFQQDDSAFAGDGAWFLKGNLYSPVRRKFFDGLLHQHLLEVHEGDVKIFVDPIATLTAGRSNERTEPLYTSTRGFFLQGSVGSKVHFTTAFVENQSRFPVYVDSIIANNGSVVPGQGMGRSFKNGGFDYARSEASLAYVPGKRLNIVLGYGKNFIGDGYRSLLLSDNSFSYPYLRVQANIWKLNYTVLYSQYMNPRYQVGDTYQRKFSTTHFISAAITKKLQVGFFESIVWQSKDSLNARGFELQYLNPVIFLRPAEFAAGSADNALMGLNVKYQVLKHGYVYGQVILDDLNLQLSRRARSPHLNNKYGFQLGMFNSRLFGVEGLQHRIELNTVRPFTYGHRKINQNYTHYNQALAHPMGANFYESINQLSFRKGRWFAEVHSVLAVTGEDYEGQVYGGNLWGGEAGVPAFGSRTLDGLRTTLSFQQLKVLWTINPAWNMHLQLQLSNRKRVNSLRTTSETLVQFGIVTNRGNFYYDY